MTPQDVRIGQKVHLLQDMGVVDPPRKAFDTAFGFGAVGHVAAMCGSWVLLLPTIPLMSAARVIKCLATVPDGSPGYHCVKASRLARYLRRLSLIACSFWTGCALQRAYTMGQPLKCPFQNDL